MVTDLMASLSVLLLSPASSEAKEGIHFSVASFTKWGENSLPPGTQVAEPGAEPTFHFPNSRFAVSVILLGPDYSTEHLFSHGMVSPRPFLGASEVKTVFLMIVRSHLPFPLSFLTQTLL